MTAYLLAQKPGLGRQARPQDPLVLPNGAFLALLSFLRLCLDASKHRPEDSSDGVHGEDASQLLGERLPWVEAAP